MGIITQIFPQCDLCKETFPDALFTTKQACREDMKEGGWKRIKGQDICFYCVETEKG